MPADCNGHDERFVRLEAENQYLQKQQEKTNAALQQMSEAITQLARESSERKAEKEIQAQVFKQLEEDRAEFTRLWARCDELSDKQNQAELRHVKAEAAAEIKRLEEERNEQKQRGRELWKTGLTIIASVAGAILLKHLGL